jgi:hypothetical protein
LIGVNKYVEGASISTRIEFEPSDMYFMLPKIEYGNLTNEQVKEKLEFQLKQFIESEKFASSFLANAKAVKIGFSNETIWPK